MKFSLSQFGSSALKASATGKLESGKKKTNQLCGEQLPFWKVDAEFSLVRGARGRVEGELVCDGGGGEGGDSQIHSSYN